MAEADPRGSADHPVEGYHPLSVSVPCPDAVPSLCHLYRPFYPLLAAGLHAAFFKCMPQLAVAFRIDGLTEKDRTTGLVYPTRLFQAVMSGFVLFILGQFALGTTVYL